MSQLRRYSVVAALLLSPLSGWGLAPSVLRAGEREDRAPRLLAVFIGGWDSDPSPEQMAGVAERFRGQSGLYQLCGDVRGARVVAEYFNWNGSRAGELRAPRPPHAAGIAEHIRERLRPRPQDRLALVGNSWGGQTALEVSRRLLDDEAPLAVHLAVFLDPSSTGRAREPPRAWPVNVNRIVQYHTRNAFVWRSPPADARLEAIDLGDPARGYMRDGRPAYDAPFNFPAHVAAEWDERIHKEIRQRLLELVDEPP